MAPVSFLFFSFFFFSSSSLASALATEADDLATLGGRESGTANFVSATDADAEGAAAIFVGAGQGQGRGRRSKKCLDSILVTLNVC